MRLKSLQGPHFKTAHCWNIFFRFLSKSQYLLKHQQNTNMISDNVTICIAADVRKYNMS